MREFKFVVDPSADWDEYQSRWDKQVLALQAEGYTIRGTGPDNDDPIRLEFVDPLDLAGPYVAFYNVVPL